MRVSLGREKVIVLIYAVSPLEIRFPTTKLPHSFCSDRRSATRVLDDRDSPISILTMHRPRDANFDTKTIRVAVCCPVRLETHTVSRSQGSPNPMSIDRSVVR